MADAMISLNDFVPYSRSASNPASTMPGTSAGIKPATGNDSFQPARIHFENLERHQPPRAEHLSRRQLRHRAHPGDRMDLAVLRANQNRRFAAQAEVRKFGHRSREHRGHAHVYRVAAAIILAHPGLGGVLASRGHRAVYAAHCLTHRSIQFAAGLPTTPARKIRRDQERKYFSHRVLIPIIMVLT